MLSYSNRRWEVRILVISWDVHCKFELIIEITFHNVSSTITKMIITQIVTLFFYLWIEDALKTLKDCYFQSKPTFDFTAMFWSAAEAELVSYLANMFWLVFSVHWSQQTASGQDTLQGRGRWQKIVSYKQEMALTSHNDSLSRERVNRVNLTICNLFLVLYISSYQLKNITYLVAIGNI